MKTVGILSMQKVINYGSYLQAYALKKLVEESGADIIEFIDIIPGKQLAAYKQHSVFEKLKTLIVGNPFKILKQIYLDNKYYPQYRRSIVDHWEDAGINLPPQIDHYNTVIIGSDEVFNCCQITPWGFSPQLYGDIKNADKVISYAASFGNTTLSDIKRLNISEYLNKYLSNLKSISVRDNNSAECIKNLTNKQPLIHIDPVLAYGFKTELDKETQITEDNYIVIYTYPNRIKDKIEINAIQRFAKFHNLKLFSLMCAYRWCDVNVVASSPLEVLQWFRKAQYIITDTFHGTIFSIITHSKFATIVRKSNYNKLTYLLQCAGTEDRMVNNMFDLGSILCNEIDYNNVESLLSDYRLKTREYLQLSI